METFVDRILLIVNTFGKSGLISKKMPGTVGSLVATIMSYVLPHSALFLFSLSLLLFILGTFTCQKYISKYPSNPDPGYIVIDEVCAIFLGNAIILVLLQYKWYLYIIIFILFRLFDIWKPYPINKIEKYCCTRKILLGFGIMVDDILAVLPTVLCAYTIIRLVSLWSL